MCRKSLVVVFKCTFSAKYFVKIYSLVNWISSARKGEERLCPNPRE
jgi:hypothetical protein